jgi:hypothetical protein
MVTGYSLFARCDLVNSVPEDKTRDVSVRLVAGMVKRDRRKKGRLVAGEVGLGELPQV